MSEIQKIERYNHLTKYLMCAGNFVWNENHVDFTVFVTSVLYFNLWVTLQY